MKQKRLNIIVILISAMSFNIMAQQQPLFSHFMFDHYYINPGAAGSSDRVNLTSVIRQQWINFGEGAPMTINFNVNAPISLFGTQSAFGLDAITDQIGYNTDLGLKLGYAIRFNVGTGKLGIGVKGGFLSPSFKMPAEWITGDNNFQTLDQSIPQKDYENEFMFDMDAGLFYKTVYYLLILKQNVLKIRNLYMIMFDIIFSQPVIIFI